MLPSIELQKSLEAASLSSQLDRGTEELESPPLEATFMKAGWSGCQGKVARSKHECLGTKMLFSHLLSTAFYLCACLPFYFGQGEKSMPAQII